ncbi:hypothetical protein A1Q2_00042 [Trichosporon asahii var. asahii CBS 8904]|uniref:Uncharacterized protein n=1 Tax=Trichosporon asahii var. asahii (strain CBS 8904) TaxID=1220162 RepID=K1VN98_TRIAC|nr:hypothetical protein A1Q2_00042 [Trichosporon asahii var. asahii CBS 8904]
MVLALLTIPSASIQWYLRYMQCGSPLDARTGKGVVPLGHATWAAVLACLVEAKESTEGEEERVTSKRVIHHPFICTPTPKLWCRPTVHLTFLYRGH